MKLSFTDEIGELYEFWFEGPEYPSDPFYYVTIQHHFTKGGWSRFSKIVFANSGIEWGHDSGVSEKAKRYIEKVTKNKAFI